MSTMSKLFFAIIAGPDLPINLHGHSMVPLWLGQVILGGRYEKVGKQEDDFSWCIYG